MHPALELQNEKNRLGFVLISLVVPVYNDLQTAKAFCHEFVKADLEQTELIIVDNGSENPIAISELSNAEEGLVRVVRLASNAGFGGGIQAGILASRSEWVVWLPGNMKVNPSELGPFIEQLKVRNQNAVVKAIRTRRTILPRIKTLIATLAQSFFSLSRMHDTGGTPTAIHRSNILFEYLTNGPKDYTFESYVVFLARKLGVPLIRVAVPYGHRPQGQSHWQSGLRSEIDLMTKILKSFPNWLKILNSKSEKGGQD